MKLSFVLIFFLLSNLLYSQSSFELHFSSSNDEIVTDVSYINNRYLAVGQQIDIITNNSDALILSFDSNGVLYDTVLLNYGFQKNIFSKIISYNNQYILVGRVENSNGIGNILISSLDYNYNINWFKTYGIDTIDEIPLDVILNNDTLIIYGRTEDYDNNGSFKGYNQFIAKCLSNGDSLDYHHINKPGLDLSGGISINNGYIISEWYPNPGPNSYLRFLNYQFINYKTINIPFEVYGQISHKLLDSDKIIYCGRIDTTVIVGGQYSSRSNIGIGIIDTNGVSINFKQYGHNNLLYFDDEALKSLAIQSKSYYLAGRSSLNRFGYDFDHNESKVIVAKLDQDLNNEWVKFYGEDSVSHYTFSINPTPDGGVIVLATTYDYRNSPTQQRDIYIIKLDSTGELNTAVPEISKTTSFEIYPNPAKEQIMVEVPNYLNHHPLHLYIYDITGRFLLKEDITAATTAIKLKNLSPGIYFATLKNKNGEFETKRFILK